MNSPQNVDGCVYKIPRKKCNKVYYSQSGKSTMFVKKETVALHTFQLLNHLTVC